MLKNGLGGFYFQEEKIILKKIKLGPREIYPLVQLSITYSQYSLLNLSLEPIAWLILEDVKGKEESKEYLIIFDKELEKDSETIFDYFEEILNIKNPGKC